MIVAAEAVAAPRCALGRDLWPLWGQRDKMGGLIWTQRKPRFLSSLLQPAFCFCSSASLSFSPILSCSGGPGLGRLAKAFLSSWRAWAVSSSCGFTPSCCCQPLAETRLPPPLAGLWVLCETYPSAALLECSWIPRGVPVSCSSLAGHSALGWGIQPDWLSRKMLSGFPRVTHYLPEQCACHSCLPPCEH